MKKTVPEQLVTMWRKIMPFWPFIVVFVGVALVTVVIVATYEQGGETARLEDTVDDDTPTDCPFRSALNGVCVASADDRFPTIFGIMIDNHSEARPQSGVSDAAVVYEVPVEGNYSRFLALYPLGQEVAEVGPVRSARPYFLDWIQEYGKALYFHVGGSPAALDEIRTRGIPDVNEFFAYQAFWRSQTRPMPYNTYTSSELWNKEYLAHSFSSDSRDSVGGQFDAWVFEEGEPCIENCIAPLRVVFSSGNHDVTWTYDATENRFIRVVAGIAHRDADDGEQVSADTVIVQYAKSTVLDGVGRLSFDTIGEGKAIIFSNGKQTTGKWQKLSNSSRTQWIDDAGNAIPLKPGHIWVEVVNQQTAVTWE